MSQIKFEGVFTTDKGAYKTGTSYVIGDLVHTEKGVYRSKVNNNATNPDTDTTSSWEVWADLTDVAAAKEVINGSITDIANLTTAQLLAITNRSFGIEWSLDDTVKTIEYVGNTSMEAAFKNWCDTSGKPCEIKKDGTDFAYLTNTSGVASTTNWLTRANGSASHYQSEDKADYLQMVEQENINIACFINYTTRKMSVLFNMDKVCPAGFRRWFKNATKLLGRYDFTPNANGQTIDCAYGLSQGTAVTWSANLMLQRLKATKSDLMEGTAWEIIVDAWLQACYYKTFDLPSSARGRGLESGGESAARNYVNGTQDSLTTPHGAVNGNSGGGYRWMYRENATDGKQWIWGAGWRGQGGTGHLTFDDEKANAAALMSLDNADVTMTYLTDLNGTYCKNVDFYTMPIEKGGSSSSGFYDGNWSNTLNDRVFYAGGDSYYGVICGPFARNVDNDASRAYWGRRGRCALNR
ncbi:MAG: hypothetical protein ACI3YZ_06540 [Prevotella sp.]